MNGRTLSHYAIEQQLGAGGMGAVYLAQDLALQRPAAVKVVADTLDRELRARLLREAETSARLQHPGIATFYESGEVDGTAFIAMEYVRGQTLRERLQRGPLDPGAAIAITAALLEALHHAHTAGILHRDIKPENVMLGEGEVPKLLDFGIARVLSVDGPTLGNLTGGGVLGTFGYMAPEQLRGEPLDERADLFALGALLYEMLTGRAAFPGATPAERVSASLTREPAPLVGSERLVALEAICRRALSKEPQARYPSASAFLRELRHLAEGTVGADVPQTLAVMDLRNLSGRPEDDWLGSGIAESVAADLVRLPGLTMVPRPKVFRAVRDAASSDRDAVDPLEVGAVLGCRWVLHGSFQRLGTAIRLTTTLSEVATGRTAASEKLDGSIDGIFDLQDRLSAAIAGGLHLRLQTPAPGAGVARRLDAFECYARGRRLWLRLEKGTLEQAGDLYRQAIALEPGHAAALSGLAAMHAMRFTFTTDPGELTLASDYAQRAIAADPRLGEPHIWLGYAHLRSGRIDDAIREEQTAGALDPANAMAPYFEGCAQTFAGRPAPAIPLLQRAVRLDPSHAFAWAVLGSAHTALGRFGEAQWCFERAVALEKAQQGPATIGAAAYLAECLRLSGQLDAARNRCHDALDDIERSDHMYRDSNRAVALCILARIAFDQHDAAAALAALQQAIAHINGRHRMLGGGHLLVQAMAGLARAGAGAHWLVEARRLFTTRDRLDFSQVWTCQDDATLVELARAALALGDSDGQALMERACEAGSIEARLLLGRGVPAGRSTQ